MPFLNDPSFMQAIIMDHYRYPHNKRTVEDESYSKIHMDSDSCVDDIYVYLKVEGNIVKDVAFDGISCTIATSSTSIMTRCVTDTGTAFRMTAARPIPVITAPKRCQPPLMKVWLTRCRTARFVCSPVRRWAAWPKPARMMTA